MKVKRSFSSIAAAACFDRIGMLGGMCASALSQRVEVGERQQVGEPEPLELRELLVVFAKGADRLGVPGDVRRVLRRAVHVDRGADRADQAEREVEEHPLEAGGGEDRERVSLPDAQGEQPVGELVDGLGGLGPGDRAPLVAALVDEVGRAGGLLGDGVLPEAGDRPRAGSRGGCGHRAIVI